MIFFQVFYTYNAIKSVIYRFKLFYHCNEIAAVELFDFKGEVVFPEVIPPEPTKLEFSSLDINTQQQLLDIIERDIFTFNK